MLIQQMRTHLLWVLHFSNDLFHVRSRSFESISHQSKDDHDEPTTN